MLKSATTVLALVAMTCGVRAVDDRRPAPFQKEETARWIAHNLTWGVLATSSSIDSLVGGPFANPYSFADGTTDASTGVPYFYLSLLDQSAQDVFVGGNTMVSLGLTEQEVGGFRACSIDKGGDPENPPCARLVLNGNFLNISGTDEEATAQEALFSRHPSMEDWPSDHSWFFAKIDISYIWLIDIYGGAAVIDPADYFAVEM